MSEPSKVNRRPLVYLIPLLALAGLIIYWRVWKERAPGDYEVRKGNYRLEDGQYPQAVDEFTTALERNPDHLYAHLGLALAYMHLERPDEALAEFNRVISLDPDLAVAYADRGILHDRQGRYRLALADYRKALALEGELLEGPGWLWRFLHNVEEAPPTIEDRAAYLKTELAKPPSERLLSVPDEDREQQMYKVDG